MGDQKFWVEDTSQLFGNLNVLITNNMSRNQKLNALTRLCLIVAAVMYYMEYEYWGQFLLLGLGAILFMYYSDNSASKEGFTRTPTYIGNDFDQTVVTPVFAEEWHIPPPSYDLYVNLPEPDSDKQAPLKPQSYPYGQYLTKTNLLPSDEYHVRQGNGSHKTAREYVNSAFLRHDLAHREDMMRLHKKKLNRRFRHNLNDTFSPYSSY